MEMVPYEQLGKSKKWIVNRIFGREYWNGYVDRAEVRRQIIAYGPKPRPIAPKKQRSSEDQGVGLSILEDAVIYFGSKISRFL